MSTPDRHRRSVYRKVEHGPITQSVLVIEPKPDGPYLLRL
jgi:hypothetical protein